MKRRLLLAASMALDGAVFAAAVLVIGAWMLGILPAVMSGHP